MEKRRVEYIDYLRGLCVTWVVWYHTTHPAFVDYSFRIPLFFFVSGIFFKLYPWKVFWRKKVNQLAIPFVLFYLIYYVFLIITNALSNHNLSDFDYSVFWGVFGLYTGFESFIVNPPLWFICALIDLQLLLYILGKCIQDRWLLMCFAIVISLSGIWFFEGIPTPFMIGRSLRYFIFYVLGHVYGKTLVSYLEISKRNEFSLLLRSFLVITFFAILRYFFAFDDKIINVFDYIEILGLIMFLIVFFKYIHQYRIVYPLKYYGMNSYIVFGMHEVYHSTFRIGLERLYGEITMSLGCVQTILTLLVLWPTIWLFNKYIPSLVAKKEFIPIPKL